ncbi:MAG: polysaccharide pyruvyl transferase family protein [Ruminococcus sp.]|nr:polysaccharide pyruvyl transferase family protein [Ruminococcus sp.]
MKIDIITLHRVRNYGSSLQTLATQNYLRKKGCKTEIIDYYPERYTSLGLLKRLKNKSERLANNPILLFGARCVISVSYVKKKLVFDSFLRKYIKMTSKTYRTENELLRNVPKADAYCTGSDQVWNSYWNEGVDRPLYLSFLPESAYKFSYAASIGTSKLSDKEKSQVVPLLKEYRHITVRENNGVEILNDAGIPNTLQMLDPTLLFKADEWNKYTSDKYKKKKYVVTYNLHHDKKIDDYAAKIAAKKNLKVLNISYNIHDIIRKGKLEWCPTVSEYLGLIRDAQYVVTDSFHATVFSLLFHTNFMVIYPEKASSRLRSILELTGLNERGCSEMPDSGLADKNIDFTQTDTVLEQERKKTDKYINMIISEIKNKK